ncbi:MAG: hypothetical protein GWN99_17540 [Gemmatimonadetes bacterium]|uniref:Lysine biosynthesis protein LysW n=1 Tax=Candidatus Kutchimonas denitrificans TaxID=3056748 RepID=A0AAE4Z8K7_9BACT|nr:hypothetical protein [Gemmatimonadota bacterium]NIR74652.1 hypothetical protein [Candidatus Kutchimonas denitrificans]NIS02842.1 hypothetical protein [Gemmatimonadota bacterium]NIT69003.1 hypothetical protein [Gemmatimonadota bacterium]NIU52308.1 hypothetical protein [Gemmatimonadota bacterium]
MATVPDLDRLDCPGCGGRISASAAMTREEIPCPDCGTEWRVEVQDVPGRSLIDLKAAVDHR